MDRLHDLRITLPKNIEDNAAYPNLEFVLLDYNSKDGLPEWVRENMQPHIESGRLSYYRTEEPQNFCPNHSRNVSFRLAKGEIVANVDSDNFTHLGYASRINDCAAWDSGRLLIVPENFLLPGSTLLLLKGRFAVYKKDIEFLRGFDEDLDVGFGNDDVNFVLRAMLAGFSIVRYESYFADDRLPTTDEERVALMKNKDFKTIMDRNGKVTWAKLARGVVSVNRGISWGRSKLVKNFSEEIILC